MQPPSLRRPHLRYAFFDGFRFGLSRRPCRTTAARPRRYSRRGSNGTCTTSSPTGPSGRPPTTSSRAEIGAYAALQGTLRKGADHLLAAMKLSRRHRAAHLQGLVLRVAQVRRGSARQPDQRAAAAGPDPVRQGQRRRAPGSTPNCCRSRCRRCRQWMADDAGAGGLPLRDRGSLPPAGARARRQGRAPAVAVEPLFVGAERRLRGAVHRRRQAPDDHAVDRAGGHADLRPVPRDPRDQPQPGRSRRGVRTRSTSCSTANVNTYASLYNGVLQRDWFHAQARGYRVDARRGAARQQHPDRRSSRT